MAISIIDSGNYILFDNGSVQASLNKPFEFQILTSDNRIRFYNLTNREGYTYNYSQITSPSSSDINDLADIVMAYNNTVLENLDFFTEISRGNKAGMIRLNKSGKNNDIDTGAAEDIWDNGGTWVAPTVSRIHALVSTSVNDTSAGTGARTILLRGISGGNITTETVTLNGTNPVNTVNSYTMIDYMKVNTAGSLGYNDGVITASAASDTTITAQINADQTNQTQMAITQVPSGYSLYIYDWDCEMYQSTATSTADVALYTKEPNGVWLERRISLLSNTGNSSKEDTFTPPLVIPALSFVKIRCTSVSNNNTKVEGFFNAALIAD